MESNEEKEITQDDVLDKATKKIAENTEDIEKVESKLDEKSDQLSSKVDERLAKFKSDYEVKFKEITEKYDEDYIAIRKEVAKMKDRDINVEPSYEAHELFDEKQIEKFSDELETVGHSKMVSKNLDTLIQKDLASSVARAMAPSAVLPVSRLPGIVTEQKPAMTLYDAMPKLPISTNSLEVVSQKAFVPLTARITTNVAANATAIKVENVTGFYVGQTVTVTGGTGVAETASRVVTAVARDKQNQITLDSGTVTVASNFGGAIAAGAILKSTTFGGFKDGDKLGMAEFETEIKTYNVVSLGISTTISRQQARDLAGLRQTVNLDMPRAISAQIERQLLIGNGRSGEEVQGLRGAVTNTVTQSGRGNNKLDTLADAVIALSNTQFHYRPNVVIANYRTIDAIWREKANSGVYFSQSAFDSVFTRGQLAGLNIVYEVYTDTSTRSGWIQTQIHYFSSFMFPILRPNAFVRVTLTA